jgi:hypothetical protein
VLEEAAAESTGMKSDTVGGQNPEIRDRVKISAWHTGTTAMLAGGIPVKIPSNQKRSREALSTR